MQPLDVCFFRPLITYYNQELCNWLKNQLGKLVTHYQLAGILRLPYRNGANSGNPEQLPADIVPKWLYFPAEVTKVDNINLEKSDSNNDNRNSDLNRLENQESFNITVKDICLYLPLPRTRGR